MTTTTDPIGAALDAVGLTVAAAKQRRQRELAHRSPALLHGQIRSLERRAAELTEEAAELRRELARRNRT